MHRLLQFGRDLFLTPRLYAAMGANAALFFGAFFAPPLLLAAQAVLMLVVALTVADGLALFRSRGSVIGHRTTPQRFSLGDANNWTVSVLNTHPFRVRVRLLDELPVQFQDRGPQHTVSLSARTRVRVPYTRRPTQRGVYAFGRLWGYIETPLRFLQRRLVLDEPASVRVYPSFLHLRPYELLAYSGSTAAGTRRIRRVGHSLEFDTLKEYVSGDDARTVNWKATARQGGLMVNTYTDARQQPVYCVLDAGRVMKMPFDGLTLLDHSVNAALALLRVTLLRQDRAGLVVFSDTMGEVVPAERTAGQMLRLQEALYALQTGYLETDYQALLSHLHRRLPQRSLLFLFTNFETLSGLERQLPYLRQLAKRHVLCVILFQNPQLTELRDRQPDTTEGLYIQTLADRFAYEKRLIVKELQRHGVLTLLTTPQRLTGDVVNRYLELKARQVI